MNIHANMGWLTPIPPANVATGTLSATVDCRGYDRCRVWAQRVKFGTRQPKMVFRVRYCTSTNTFASGTAFSTALGVSAAALSTTVARGFDIDMTGVGPYLTVLLSTATASGATGVLAIPYNSKYNPTGTSTTGIAGFTSLTYSPAQP